MSQVLVSESSLADIGAAIRGKNGSTDTYLPSEMGPAIEALEDPSVLTTKQVTENGTYDAADDEADGYSVVTVNVPNSYEAADEGKVVSAGALVAQTSTTVTQNGTVDTTLNNEVVVNVPSQAPTLVSKTITQNGTYDPEDDSADGYSEVTVNVPSSARIKQLINDGYYCNEAGALICTLNGRPYTKFNSDPAFVAYVYNGSDTCPLLVSETSDGAKYVALDETISPIGTEVIDGTTYYVSGRGYYWVGDFMSSDGVAQRLSESAVPAAEQASMLVEKAHNGGKLYANGSYPVPSGYDGWGDVIVDVEAKIKQIIDEDYYCDEAGTVICTLHGRVYEKRNSDPAYVAYVYNGGFTGPLLISETADGAKYSVGDSSFASRGTEVINGTTYYVSGTEYWVSGNVTSVDGIAHKLSESAVSNQNQATALMEKAGYGRLTANGSYPVPSGYDGWGDIVVDVEPNVGTKSITQNGTYTASTDGYHGYSKVFVNVSGGGGGSFNELAVVIDNPNNASKSFQMSTSDEVPPSTSTSSGMLSYVFLYADNQTTNMTIGGNVYPSSDLRPWSVSGDNAFIIADSTAFADESVNLAMNSGDAGNHACTLVGYTGKTLAYSQSAYLQSSASVVTDKSLPNAYVVFLFSVYYGGATATVDFMGESLTVPRYTNRYSNSIYYMIRKVSDVASGTTISAQIQGVSASNVIGMLGVFE